MNIEQRLNKLETAKRKDSANNPSAETEFYRQLTDEELLKLWDLQNSGDKKELQLVSNEIAKKYGWCDEH